VWLFVGVLPCSCLTLSRFRGWWFPPVPTCPSFLQHMSSTSTQLYCWIEPA
jgi:hypothetical protein